jgi:hypothetical protein
MVNVFQGVALMILILTLTIGVIVRGSKKVRICKDSKEKRIKRR